MIRFKEFIKESPDSFNDGEIDYCDEGAVVFSTIPSSTLLFSPTQCATHNEMMLVAYYREVGKKEFIENATEASPFETTGDTFWMGNETHFQFSSIFDSDIDIHYIGKNRPTSLMIARNESGMGDTYLNGRVWTHQGALSIWEDFKMLKEEFSLVKKMVNRLGLDVKRLRYEVGEDIFSYKDLIGRSAERKYTTMADLKGKAHLLPGKWKAAMRDLD